MVANARGNVTVDATSNEKILSISAGAAVGGTAAVSVNAAVSVINVTTRAYIGGGPAIADGAVVDADGSVRIAALEQNDLSLIAGNLSISGSASVGAAVSVPIVTKTTEAFIGDNATVNGRGNGTGLAVSTGAFTVTIQDTRFDPNAAGTITGGDTINLGYNHGFQTGDLVDTYARSAFEDTRRKAEKFGARGATITAVAPGSPRRRDSRSAR